MYACTGDHVQLFVNSAEDDVTISVNSVAAVDVERWIGAKAPLHTGFM